MLDDHASVALPSHLDAASDIVTREHTANASACAESHSESLPPHDIDEPALPEHALLEQIAALRDDMSRVTTLMGDAIQLARHRERTIDRLHAENEALRAGQLDRALAPVLRDLIRLYDVLGDGNSAAAACALANAEDADVRAQLRDDILDVLFRQGCDPFDARVGDAFDPSCHQAIGACSTTEASSHQQIAEQRRIGFRHNGRVIRAAHVRVFRYQPPPASTDGHP
jgi:molecular chaperone GrpE